MLCVSGLEVKALRSGAGWYLGTLALDGSPNCRISTGYTKTKKEAEQYLQCDRQFAMENAHCNQGCGCFNHGNFRG